MEIKRLASGSLVEVVGGKAVPLTCSWLVEVPTFNPEPDFPEDCYRTVECGARVRSLDGTTTLDHTTCENGHDRHAYGSAEWREADMIHALRERFGDVDFA